MDRQHSPAVGLPPPVQAPGGLARDCGAHAAQSAPADRADGRRPAARIRPRGAHVQAEALIQAVQRAIRRARIRCSAPASRRRPAALAPGHPSPLPVAPARRRSRRRRVLRGTGCPHRRSRRQDCCPGWYRGRDVEDAGVRSCSFVVQGESARSRKACPCPAIAFCHHVIAGLRATCRRSSGFSATDGMRDVTDATTRFGSEPATPAGAELSRGDRRHSCTAAVPFTCSWSRNYRTTGVPRIIVRQVGRVTRSEPPNASSIATKRHSRNPSPSIPVRESHRIGPNPRMLPEGVHAG